MVFNNIQRFVKLVQNQSLEVSHPVFVIICLKKVLKIFGKTFWTTKCFHHLQTPVLVQQQILRQTKRCRQMRFPILFALTDLTD